MKKLWLLFLPLLYLLSCKKDKTEGLQEQLRGTWELRTAGGGYLSLFIVYPAGNGNKIIFSGNNQYTRTDIASGDTTESSGSYTITKGSTCYSNEVTFIQFSDNGADKSLTLEISADTLRLDANSCIIADGINRSYEKIR